MSNLWLEVQMVQFVSKEEFIGLSARSCGATDKTALKTMIPFCFPVARKNNVSVGFVSRQLFTHFLYKQRCQVLNRSTCTEIASRCSLTVDDWTAVYRVCTNSRRTAAIIGSISAVSRVRMSVGSFSRTAAGNRAYSYQCSKSDSDFALFLKYFIYPLIIILLIISLTTNGNPDFNQAKRKKMCKWLVTLDGILTFCIFLFELVVVYIFSFIDIHYHVSVLLSDII